MKKLFIFMILLFTVFVPVAVSEFEMSSEQTDIVLSEFNSYLQEYSYWISVTGNQILTSAIMELPYHLRPYIVALVRQESNFNSNAIGKNRHSSDYGLFQLNSSVYKNYTKKQLLDTEFNVQTGIRHFLTELDRFDGDVERALTAYNAGYSRARDYKEPVSTQNHVKRIMNVANIYQKSLDSIHNLGYDIYS